MALSDYEFKYGENGMTLNGNDSMPTVGSPVFDIDTVAGLDLPDVKSTSKDHDGWDGGAVEAAYFSTRTIVLKGTLFCHANDSLEYWLDKLKRDFAPVDITQGYEQNSRYFYVKAPGVLGRRIVAKSLGVKYVWDTSRRFNSTAFQITLMAAEPFFQSLQGKSLGPVNQSVKVTYFNEGTAPVYPLIIVKAVTVVTSPIKIQYENTGQGVQIDSANLAIGEEVYFDMKGRSINKVVGFAATNWRNRTTNEGWFALKPGGNVLTLYVASGLATMVVNGTDAWF